MINHAERMLQGAADIVDGLVTILSFGFFSSSLSFSIGCWRVKRECTRAKAAKGHQ